MWITRFLIVFNPKKHAAKYSIHFADYK